MCLLRQLTCGCGATLNESTRSCNGADTYETPPSKLALSECPNLAPWDPELNVRCHAVQIVRLYETHCLCKSRGLEQESGTQRQNPQDQDPSPAYRQHAPEETQTSAVTMPVHGVTVGVASHTLFAVCGCAVEHVSWEAVKPFGITPPRQQIESREERDYLQTGPPCKQCLEAKHRQLVPDADFQGDFVKTLQGVDELNLSASTPKTAKNGEIGDTINAFGSLTI